MISLGAVGNMVSAQRSRQRYDRVTGNPLSTMTNKEAAAAGMGGSNTTFVGNKNGNPLTDQRAAQRQLENVAAARQQTYSDIYEPTSNALRDMAIGKGPDARERLAEVGADAASAFDANSGSISREQRALGLDATGNQNKRLSLRRLISEVDARNNEAESLRSQQQTAQEYSIQQQASMYDQQSSIFGSIAEREAKRRGDSAIKAANQQSAAMGAAGLAISLAMMM